jgi:hypothetical protein
MRMGGDEQPSSVCLVNDRTQLSTVNWGANASVRGVLTPPLADHDLHDVHTLLDAVLHRPAQLIDAPSLATHVPAMPTWARDRRPRGQHRRHSHVVPVAVAPVDHRPASVTEVTHGRDPESEVGAQRVLNDRGHLLVTEGGQAIERAEATITAEMYVRIDQSGQHRRVREINHATPVWQGHSDG